jgi:hypothetical protein
VTFTIAAFEGDDLFLEGFTVGESDDMLEAQFLARDEFEENPATRAVAVVKDGVDIVYCIGRFEGSGYTAYRDGRNVTSINEALQLLRKETR